VELTGTHALFAVATIALVCLVGATAVSLRSLSWPSAQATVIRCEVVDVTGSDEPPSYRIDLAYSYTVDGRSYEGSRIRIGLGSMSLARARHLQSWFRAGSTHPAYYHPRHPDTTVLFRGPSPVLIASTAMATAIEVGCILALLQ